MVDARRQAAVASLLRLDRPIEEIARDLDLFPLDCDEGEALVLTRDYTVDVLWRFVWEELSDGELESWAKIIQGRLDVEFENDLELLKEIIFVLANPEITHRLTDAVAMEWMSQLEAT